MPPLRRLIDSLPPARKADLLAHPAATTERPSPYERLEFLGDSVLGFVVARRLYERYPEYSEGALTRVRAAVVSRRSCAEIGTELGLDELLATAHDERKLRVSDNVVAAALEVAIACCYLEFGLPPTEEALIDAFGPAVEDAVATPRDFKTQLQEELARRGATVLYEVVAQDGPPHARVFTCAALVDGVEVGRGTGRSKKDAEQEAARQALAHAASASETA